MSSTARILRFPVRQAPPALTADEAKEFARDYLTTPANQRAATSNPDVLSAICRLLREQRDSNPRMVAEESSAIYRMIRACTEPLGVFDEKDYFLGESAFIAGNACRLIGLREEALRWLDRAEAGFRHTVNPGPGLSNVAYARLALRFEMGQYEDVLELIPSVSASFEKLEMDIDLAKSRLLQGMALKQCGRFQEALDALGQARNRPGVAQDAALHARILAEVGDVHQLDGRFDEAMEAYMQAMPLLESDAPSLALADLQMFVGSAYRGQGHLKVALEALRSAASIYAELGMVTRVAYTRLFLADTLLGLGRHREAEWEILATLPIIEEQKMVPEGFAAVSLLKESVRQRKTDPKALRELRDQLQSKS